MRRRLAVPLLAVLTLAAGALAAYEVLRRLLWALAVFAAACAMAAMN